MNRAIFFTALLFTLALGQALGSEWNQYRGPNGSGLVRDSQPPIKPSGDNLAWQTEISPGFSAPVLSAKRIFLTGLAKGRLVTLALDKASGKILWQKKAPKVELEKVHKASHPAASSALVSGNRVFAYFGSYGLLCYDLDGEELWKKPMPTPKTLYGMSTSPIAHGDLIIMVLDNDANLPDSRLSQSKVVAFRQSDGEIAWEIPRPFHRSGWSTPMILAAQPGHRVGRPRQRPCQRIRHGKRQSQNGSSPASPARPSPRRWPGRMCCTSPPPSWAVVAISSSIPCRSGRP